MKSHKIKDNVMDDVLNVIADLINNPVGFLFALALIVGLPIKYPSILPYEMLLVCIISYAVLTYFLFFSGSGVMKFYSRTKKNVKFILEFMFGVILCSLVPSLIIAFLVELISKPFADKYYNYIVVMCLIGTLFAFILDLNKERDELREKNR